MFRSLFLACCAALIAAPAPGHEFWLEPGEYQPATGDAVSVALKNGEAFAGLSLPYLDGDIARFSILSEGSETPYDGRMGDLPALTLPQVREGLLVVVHQTTPSRLTYSDGQKFRRFVTHKDADWVLERHEARGLPQDGFEETYTRFAKTLIGVGDGAGADRATGMETELVALANPYTDPLPEGLPVRLLYRGAPRPDAQIEVFERAPDGLVTVTTIRTDGEGRALIPLQSGHDYQLDAVVLREAPEDGTAVWESLWANLTFAVP